MAKDNELPKFVNREGMISDSEYIDWLSSIKQRLQSSQVKATFQINKIALEFNWSLGRNLVEMEIEKKWGSGVIKQLSLDLRTAYPGIKGLSVDNLYFMRRWYAFYHQWGCAELFDQAGQILIMPTIFASVPWRHHVEIIKKCTKIEEALFYIHKTIEGSWSRAELEENLSSNLYERQGRALTNFDDQKNLPQGDLAQNILKDPYDFSFLRMYPGYNEQDFEDALISNITRFLLELGQGFAFVGRQMELQMPNGKSYFPDLVFYHVKLKCYVVIELKVVDFIPEFVGKLNFYVSAADELLKQVDDNPTIGLLVCKSHDKTTVEWSFRGIDRPIGVASYQLQEVVERTLAEMKSNENTKNN